MSEAYRDAGVDLELGDELSQMLYEASKLTWQNRQGVFGEPTSSVDAFRGLRDMSIRPFLNVPDPDKIHVYQGDDGVGTKVEVAQRMGKHDTVAFDLLAMVVDDAAIKGYEPATVTTTLDVRKLLPEMKADMQQLARGYVLAAAAARVALVNGEVAELGDLIGRWDAEEILQDLIHRSIELGGDARLLQTWNPAVDHPEPFSYSWSATLLAIGHEERLLDGTAVAPGDALVGFRETGFRSNGLSLVRKTLGRHLGSHWHEVMEPESGKTWGELVLEPSTIYSPVLVDAIGGYNLIQEQRAEVHGAAHITGGGLPGKFGDLLNVTGVGATIEDPFEQPLVMSAMQSMAGISDEEAYHVWNMGTGMVVATPEPEKLVAIAGEHGVEAKQIGEVTRMPVLRVLNRGIGGRTGLEFPLK